MKRSVTSRTSETLFLLFLGILILSINYLPVIYHFIITPPNRIYTGTVFYSDDYSYYLSVIQQGIDGRWTALDKYTPEPHEGTLMHFHYLILGKIGKLFHFSSILTYHFSRLILGTIFLLTIYYLLTRIFPPSLRNISFLIILFSISWPMVNTNASLFWQKVTPLLLEPNPVVRFATQPHFLLGSIYSLIAILFFTQNRMTIIKTALFLIFTFYATLTDPAQIMVILLAVMLYLAFLIALEVFKKKHLPFKKIIVYFSTLLVAFLAFFYLKTVRNLEPWKTISLFDTIQGFPATPSDFFLSFGPAAILAIAGILGLFTNKRFSSKINRNSQYIIDQIDNYLLLLFFWIISAFLLIFVFSTPFGINRLRLFHTPLFVSLGIFATYGIHFLAKTIHKRFSSISTNLVSFGLILLFIGLSIPPLVSSFMEQITFLGNTNSALTYPPKTHVEAFNYLYKNTKRDDAILCLYEACNQIPFFSGNTVFLGNITGTLNEKNKSELAQKIFSGNLPSSELSETLKTYNIKYLFVGYQEGFWQMDFTKYPYLEKAYQNQGASIYKVNLY